MEEKCIDIPDDVDMGKMKKIIDDFNNEAGTDLNVGKGEVCGDESDLKKFISVLSRA